MAGENAEVVRRVFAAFDAGDIEGFVALLEEDVDWAVSGYLTGDRHLRGAEAVREWLHKVAALGAAGETIRIEQDTYRELGEETVLVLGRGRIERDEGPLEEDLGWIYRVRDGKVAYMKDYLSREEAEQAAEELDDP